MAPEILPLIFNVATVIFVVFNVPLDKSIPNTLLPTILDDVKFSKKPNVPFNVPVLRDTLAKTVPDVILLIFILVPVAFVNTIFDTVPFVNIIFACVSVAILKLATVINETTPFATVPFTPIRFDKSIVPVLVLVLANIVPNVILGTFNVPPVKLDDNTF